ncbi:MAG: tripartite tricarboxylate transporter substrate binding protein [Betaproteobacteria bacterium]
MIASAAMAAFVFAFAHAHAAEAPYPAKPIRIIIATTVGSGPDILARQIGAKLTQAWGQQVVIDPRAGASGMIGAELTANAAADGYTLWMATMSHVIATTMYQRLLLARDFAPITQVASTPYVIAVNAALPANSIAELIAYAKARPGAVLYGSAGQGSTPHLCIEAFKSMTATNLLHVPYRGAAPALTDLMSGHVQVSCVAAPAVQSFARSGKLRALGVTTLSRTPLAPDVPAVAESVPGYELVGWYGLLAPLGTPKNIVNKISSEIARALKTTEVQERLVSTGAEAVESSPAEFTKFLEKETLRWGKVLRDAGIKPTP